MKGLLIVIIEVLVYAVLLHHKYLASDSEKFVEFVCSQLRKGFFMKDKFHIYAKPNIGKESLLSQKLRGSYACDPLEQAGEMMREIKSKQMGCLANIVAVHQQILSLLNDK